MTRTIWSPEEDATLREWCSKYPKGRCINIKQIKFMDKDRWDKMVAAHSERSIYDKAWRMMSGKPSNTKRATLQADGTYKCDACGELVRNKQALAGHYRSKHGVTRAKAPIVRRALEIDRVLESEIHPPKQLRHVKFCPECGCSLTAYNMAANANDNERT